MIRIRHAELRKIEAAESSERIRYQHGHRQVLNGTPRFRDREHAQKARRLLALTSASLQLGRARKEGERDTLALAETLGSAQD
jgi:hypothetical protein